MEQDEMRLEGLVGGKIKGLYGVLRLGAFPPPLFSFFFSFFGENRQ